ncbi:MAG: hypothetical protein ACPLZB_01055, partial [Caldisericaceae bacterium]
MKSLLPKRTSQSYRHNNHIGIIVVLITALVISFVFYSDYKIYGSFFTERLEDSISSQYYVSLILLFVSLILLEIITSLFASTRKDFMWRTELSQALINLVESVIDEPKIEEKLKVGFATLRKIVPVGSAALIASETSGLKTVYIENQNEKDVLEKSILTQNSLFLVEEFK